MAEVAVQDVEALAGVAPNYAAASAGGDTVPVLETDRKLLLHVKNGDAAQHSVTIDDVRSVAPSGAQSYNPDPQISVPAGGERLIQLTQLGRFRDGNGNINLSWSASTGMTFAVFRLR